MAADLTAAARLWGQTTGRIPSIAAYAAGPSWGRRRPCGNANCQRSPACHGGVDEKVCSLSVRIGFMYGALASDGADASAGSGACRAVRLISAYIIASCLSHNISVSHIRRRCHLVLLATPWNLSAYLLTGRFDQSPAGQESPLRIIIYRWS